MRTVFAALVCLLGTMAQAQTPDILPPGVPMNEQEQKFADLLSGATLVGSFSMELRPDANPKPERYAIQAVRKVGDRNWIVQARITYGQVDIPVPVPVQVEWAGDTPMIQVTNLNIPLVGDGFTSRILFYGQRYAGTWQHGKVGGHMWGIADRPMGGR